MSHMFYHHEEKDVTSMCRDDMWWTLRCGPLAPAEPSSCCATNRSIRPIRHIYNTTSAVCRLSPLYEQLDSTMEDDRSSEHNYASKYYYAASRILEQQRIETQQLTKVQFIGRRCCPQLLEGERRRNALLNNQAFQLIRQHLASGT